MYWQLLATVARVPTHQHPGLWVFGAIVLTLILTQAINTGGGRRG